MAAGISERAQALSSTAFAAHSSESSCGSSLTATQPPQGRSNAGLAEPGTAIYTLDQGGSYGWSSSRRSDTSTRKAWAPTDIRTWNLHKIPPCPGYHRVTDCQSRLWLVLCLSGLELWYWWAALSGRRRAASFAFRTRVESSVCAGNLLPVINVPSRLRSGNTLKNKVRFRVSTVGRGQNLRRSALVAKCAGPVHRRELSRKTGRITSPGCAVLRFRPG